MSNIKIIDINSIDYLSTICGRFVNLEFNITINNECITDWFLYDTLNECLVNYTIIHEDEAEADFWIRGFHSNEAMPIAIMEDITFSEHGKFLVNEMKTNPDFVKKVKAIVIDSMI